MAKRSLFDQLDQAITQTVVAARCTGCGGRS